MSGTGNLSAALNQVGKPGSAFLEVLEVRLFVDHFELAFETQVGWCHIHGYAHLKLEGRLAMVNPAADEEHIRLASARLGALIRGFSADA